MLASASASVRAMSSRSAASASGPRRAAASSASPTAAARPLKNTLRASLREAASPTGPSSTVTGAFRGRSSCANRSAPGPDTSMGVRMPLPGTGLISATSATRACGPSNSATAFFLSGEEVFSSA